MRIYESPLLKVRLVCVWYKKIVGRWRAVVFRDSARLVNIDVSAARSLDSVFPELFRNLWNTSLGDGESQSRTVSGDGVLAAQKSVARIVRQTSQVFLEVSGKSEE